MYKATWTFTSDWVGPIDFTTGSDRLSWVSPYPEVHDRTVNYVNSGALPRYWGPLDFIEIDPTNQNIIQTAAFYSLDAITEWVNYTRANLDTYPVCISVTDPIWAPDDGYPPQPTPV